MVTLSITKPLQIKTPDGVIERLPGDMLNVNSLVFGLTLIEAGKAKMENDSLSMVEIMKELLRLDHETDSDLYLDERIQGSEAIVQAYQAGTKQQFVEQALALIKVYLKCKRSVN